MHHSNSTFMKGTSTAHNTYKIIEEAHASRQHSVHSLHNCANPTRMIIMLAAHEPHQLLSFGCEQDIDFKKLGVSSPVTPCL